MHVYNMYPFLPVDWWCWGGGGGGVWGLAFASHTIWGGGGAVNTRHGTVYIYIYGIYIHICIYTYICICILFTVGTS